MAFGRFRVSEFQGFRALSVSRKKTKDIPIAIGSKKTKVGLKIKDKRQKSQDKSTISSHSQLAIIF